MTDKIVMQNVTAKQLDADDFGGLHVPPGGTCEIEVGYTRSRYFGSQRQPSLIEERCPGLRPVDPIQAAIWGKHCGTIDELRTDDPARGWR